MAPLATNIEAADRRRRYGLGAAALGLGIAGTAAMLWRSVDVGWRVWLFVPFLLAGLDVFQAGHGT